MVALHFKTSLRASLVTVSSSRAYAAKASTMVTAEEALISRDPKEIKRLRGSISTQITIDINLLEKELAKKAGGSFDLDKDHKECMGMHQVGVKTHPV